MTDKSNRSTEEIFPVTEEGSRARTRRQMGIYIAIAYGLTALMGIGMYAGLRKHIDLTSFVSAQMMYPACGVIAGKLITRRTKEKLPMAGYIAILTATAAMILVSICSLFIALPLIEAGAAGTADYWNVISQFILIAASLIAGIGFLASSREKRENAGIRGKNAGRSARMIGIFILLFIARSFIFDGVTTIITGSYSDETIKALAKILRNPASVTLLFALPANFLFSFAAFFGEEYGWRYYLQPVMQKRFGLRKGVLLLGLVWAVWHLPVDFMYYTVEDGPVMFLVQIITCVSLSIFLGYAYMRTQNIWVPVAMHYLNNNLAVILSGGGADALQNQHVPVSDIPVMLAGALVYAVFIFASVYREKTEGGSIYDRQQEGTDPEDREH